MRLEKSPYLCTRKRETARPPQGGRRSECKTLLKVWQKFCQVRKSPYLCTTFASRLTKDERAIFFRRKIRHRDHWNVCSKEETLTSARDKERKSGAPGTQGSFERMTGKQQLSGEAASNSFASCHVHHYFWKESWIVVLRQIKMAEIFLQGS